MKTKVIALLGRVNAGKKKPGSGMVNVCLQYPDGQCGTHVVYSEDIGDLANIKPGDVLDLDVKFQEFAFFRAVA